MMALSYASGGLPLGAAIVAVSLLATPVYAAFRPIGGGESTRMLPLRQSLRPPSQWGAGPTTGTAPFVVGSGPGQPLTHSSSGGVPQVGVPVFRPDPRVGGNYVQIIGPDGRPVTDNSGSSSSAFRPLGRRHNPRPPPTAEPEPPMIPVYPRSGYPMVVPPIESPGFWPVW